MRDMDQVITTRELALWAKEEGIREASLTIGDMPVNVAVVHGTANARRVIDWIRSGVKQYHFIEVMTCPGGCIGGGGQPRDLLADADDTQKSRISGLYQRDRSMKRRMSHENSQIKSSFSFI